MISQGTRVRPEMRTCVLFALLVWSGMAETRFVRTVTWQWARDYIDQDVYVTGTVVAGYELGDRCFLRFENDSKYSFVVIISGEQLKTPPFATPVHAMYVDQPVRIRGVIRENKARNRAEMHVQDLSKIEYGDDVLAQPLPLPDEIPDPEPEAEPEPVEAPAPEPVMETSDAVPALDPGPSLLPPPVPVPEPVPAPVPEPMPAAENAGVPPLDPGPALLAVPKPEPVVEPEPAIAAAEPEPVLEPEPAIAAPEPVPEPEAEAPVIVAEPAVDDTVAAITLDDAVLDLAAPKPNKPTFKKLDLSEMEVQVIASSTSKAFPGEEDAHVIVDGKSKGSFWSSENSDAQEITIDLKAQFLLKSVALHWESPAAKYSLRTSQDGVIWQTVSEEASDEKGRRADRVRFDATPARFLRIQMTERVAPTRGYSLFEIEMIGSPVP
jgi:hypothetical protein